MSKSNWDKGFTSGAKAAREASANSVCTICCDGCKEHGERIERDRIIELIDELDLSFTNEETNEFIVGDALDLIALIKGKN